ncbi:MAG: VCBS repeat-containing protein, partial [Chloroflexi bacterium]|nr:VCBS repeat-containing protein [Chloroflexota bacterium]
MKINKRILLVAAGVVCLIGLMGIGVLWRTNRIATIANRVKAFVAYQPGNVSMLPFEFTEIDASAGDIKLVGDIDGDNYPDLIIGGFPNEPLSWYQYPEWDKHVIAAANTEFTTDGALGDIDGDGDLDIVVPDGRIGNNLVWFKNPRPSGDPQVGSQWTRHEIGATDSWAKDVELADFDNNGRLDVATRRDSAAMIFFQVGDNSWSQMTFSGVSLGSEGMAVGDVDSDGHMDVVLKGVWVKNPGGIDAQTAVNWIEYTIGSANSDFKALVVDLNQDGYNDVLFSSSENTADVNWWEADGGDPTGSWTSHTILSSVEKAHTLQAADMDLDGDLDVVVAQMHTSSNQEIMVLNNRDGQATTWAKEVVATGGLHNGVVADVGNDGDYDIYGANWTGNPPVRLWENRMEMFVSVSKWTYKEIAS